MGGGVKGGVTTLERHLFTTHVCVSVYAEYECVDGTGYSWGAKQRWKVRDAPLDRNHSCSWSTKTSHFQCFNTTAKSTESWALNKICLVESTDYNQHSKRNMSCLTHLDTDMKTDSYRWKSNFSITMITEWILIFRLHL